MPQTFAGRLVAGTLLIAGGILGFLPILGFWMIPLGLYFLSHDFAVVRRFRRRMTVRGGRWWKRKAAPRVPEWARRHLPGER